MSDAHATPTQAARRETRAAPNTLDNGLKLNIEYSFNVIEIVRLYMMLPDMDDTCTTCPY